MLPTHISFVKYSINFCSKLAFFLKKISVTHRVLGLPRILGPPRVLGPHKILGLHRVLGLPRVLGPHRLLGPLRVLRSHRVLGPHSVLGPQSVLGPGSWVPFFWYAFNSWSFLFINKTLQLNNLKTRSTMNAKILLCVICVEATIYLLLNNLHDCTFN